MQSMSAKNCMYIRKKITPNSEHYVIESPLLRGHHASKVSNQITADFDDRTITYDQTITMKPSHSKTHKSNCTTLPEFSCNIFFNGSPNQKLHITSHASDHQSHSCHIDQKSSNRHNHSRTKNQHKKVRHKETNYIPPIYAPLNQSNSKTINYFNRTVVMPSISKCYNTIESGMRLCSLIKKSINY